MKMICYLMFIMSLVVLAGCLTRGNKGPDEFGVYIDKQWNDPLDLHYDRTMARCTEWEPNAFANVLATSNDITVCTVSSKFTLYVYPTTWVVRGDGAWAVPDKITIKPIAGDFDGYYCALLGEECGTAQVMDNIKVGGTEDEPIKVTPFVVELFPFEDDRINSGFDGWYFLDFWFSGDQRDGNACAVVRLK